MLDPVLLITGVVDAVSPMTQLAMGGDPAGLLPARQQMALSLGWHIILACFGVAFPAMIFLMHLKRPRFSAAAV